MSYRDQADGLRGLKKFLEEARKVLHDQDDHDDSLEKIENVLGELKTALPAFDAMANLEEGKMPISGGAAPSEVQEVKDVFARLSKAANQGDKPLIAGAQAPADPAAPVSRFPDAYHEKKFRELEQTANEVSPPPQDVVKALSAWLTKTWKTRAYWEAKDVYEQTWDLMALARSLFKAGGIDRDPEFKSGPQTNGVWASSIVGEKRTLSLGMPSVVWCIHEVVHLALNEDDEKIAWTATIRLIKDAFATIDPTYAQERLEAEFDHQVPVKPKAQPGWGKT